MELLPKARAIKAIHLEEPDQVPIYITITPQVAEKLSREIGIHCYSHADSRSENRISFTELLLKLGNDIVGIGACSPKNNPTREIECGILINEWKMKYRKVGYYSEKIEYPLSKAEKISDIDNYEFPDPYAEGRYDLAKEVAEKYGHQYALCADLECTIFETSWGLIGMEKFLVDLLMRKDYVFALMDRVMEYHIKVGKELIKIGADMIWLGDDVGTQKGMLISPALWREVLKERMRKVIEELKAVNPNIGIAYHCCGSYAPIIPDLIEIGVNILNALQPAAKDMDLKKLKDVYGNEICFFGGLDIQKILPFGSLEDIENEVKRIISSAAKGGGFIFAGAHNIQPDTSVEKVVNLFQLVKRYGKYPMIV